MLKHIESAEDSDALERSMAAVAAAISDPSRVKMLCALMDGRAWTATELGAAADIASSTASAHLSRLVSGKLITCLCQGRYRYYHLAGQDIAELIEKIMGVSWRSATAAKISTPASLRKARTCYDHLAGEIAVDIYDFMIAENWLAADGSSVTPTGQKQFRQLGMTLNAKTRRKACCACLDWSERRFHLGGEAGAVFLLHCEQKGWISRAPGFREVNFTASGRLACEKWFGVMA